MEMGGRVMHRNKHCNLTTTQNTIYFPAILLNYVSRETRNDENVSEKFCEKETENT